MTGGIRLFFPLALKNQSILGCVWHMLNSSGCILVISWLKNNYSCHMLCTMLENTHFYILTLTIWQNEVILTIQTPYKSSLFPGLYTTFCLFLIATYLNMLLNNEWQVTGYRGLNSHGTQFHFPFFFLQPESIFLRLHCIKGRPDQSGARAAKFYRPPLSFLFTHFHRWYPASVSLKQCLSWQPCSAVF